MNSAVQGTCFGVLACLLTVGAAAAAKAPVSDPSKPKVSLALTVPDKQCPELVRPFEIGGNLQKLGEIALKDEADNFVKKHDHNGVIKKFGSLFHKTAPADSPQADQGTAAGQATAPNPTTGGNATAPSATNTLTTAATAVNTAATAVNAAQSLGLAAKFIPGASLLSSAASAASLVHGTNGAQTGPAQTPANSPTAAQDTSATTGDISDDLRRAMKQLDWLPMAAEVEYGRRDHESELNDILSRESKEGKKLYPIADAMLHDILANVKEPTGYDFNVFILKTDDHNAIARPGGFVYLDAGLIKDPKLRPKAEFALAHEVAHVLQRHETLELQGLIVDSLAFRKDIADAIAKMKNDPSTVLARIKLDKNQYVRYHLDQELQADSCSARLLGRVYDDPLPLAKSVGAFLEDLPADNAVTTTMSATTTAGGGASGLGAAPANQTLAVVAKTTVVTEEIVNEPARSHPSSLERRQNLTAMYQEVTSEIATRRLVAIATPAEHASASGGAHHGAHTKTAGNEGPKGSLQ